MSAATWKKSLLLLQGALLCTGARRITSILRVLGLSEERRFEKYHRVLNRDKWSCALSAKILLGLLIPLLPEGFPILIAVDETLERRKGKKIRAKGCYRDAIRSTEKKVVTCFGLKWICMALIVPLPWNKRPWALPFMTVLAPSKQSNEQRGRKHRTVVDWTQIMVKLVSRWIKRKWILVGDGAYACIALGHRCNLSNVTLISRLRLDANLYDFPGRVPEGQCGRKPAKGKKLMKLKKRAQDRHQKWVESEINWYGGKKKTLTYVTGISLWYKAGERPLPVRWVLVIDPEKPDRPEAFFSTDTAMNATKIIEYFVLRWNIEGTFQEARAHLGVETQRQWSDKAIGRTTPVLFGMYSLACLMAKTLSQSTPLYPAMASWYHKQNQATFSDVIALVRRAIWSEKYLSNSTVQGEAIKIPRHEFNSLINQLAMAS